MGEVVETRKQTNGGGLLSEQDRFDDRRLAASFVEMAGALPCRPEPRHLFDNAASPGRVAYRGRVLVMASHSVLNQAIALNDHSVLDETAQRVERHWDHAQGVAMAPYYQIVSGETTLAEAADRAVERMTHGTAALTRWALDASRQTDAQLIEHIESEVTALLNLREQLIAKASAPLNRRAMMSLA